MSATAPARATCALCGAVPCQQKCTKTCPLRVAGTCQSGRLAVEIEGTWRYVCYRCVSNL